MGCGILLGFLGGMAVAKLARALCAYRWGHHGGGGGCGPSAGCGPETGSSCGPGHGGHHWGGWGRQRWGGPFRLFWLARELDLDAHQRQEAYRIFSELRRSVSGLRQGREQAFGVLLDALSQEAFERSRLDALADEKAGRLGELKEQLVNGLAAFHAILSPEQRARLREILARQAGHPYRSGGDGGQGVTL